MTPHPPDFPCPECTAVFRKKKHLRYHEDTVHTTERKYKCDQCENTYKRSTHLRRHIQNSHSSLKFHCELEGCDKVFSGREQLRKHMRRHETKGSHVCELCGKLFSKKRQVEAHYEKIHGPFSCSTCAEQFYSRREFRFHLLFHPLDEKSQDDVSKSPTMCSVCGSQFSRSRDLRYHILKFHGSSDQSATDHTCTTCGVQFSSLSNLNTHIRAVHEGLRNFSCHICNDSFAYKHVLARHIRTRHEEDDKSDDTSSSSPIGDESEPLPVFPKESPRPNLRTLIVSNTI